MKTNVNTVDKNHSLMTQCPLCGARFDTKDNEGCRACPQFMKCSLLLCPNCGYEFPDTV